MVIEIPNDIATEFGESEQNLKIELAIIFYRDFKISSGKAAKFANMSRIEFWFELEKRQIPLNLDDNSVEQDLKTLEKLGL